MPAVPLSDELARQAADAFKAHGVKTAAADSLGWPHKTFHYRLNIAAQRGMLGFKPVLPGFRVSQTTTVKDADGNVKAEFIQQKEERGDEFAVPPGHVVKGVSALLDPDGREIIKWVKTREGELDPEQLVAWIKEAFADYATAATPVAAPAAPSSDLLTLIPLADWHIGMFAWGKETDTNWDLKIAESAIGAALDDLVMRSPMSGEAVVLGGGDLIHSDSNENKTAKSSNALQVDGRYQKVIATACRLTERTVDLARRRHDHVRVRILPGNHDEHACVAVGYHLAALYRHEPRVTVDLDPSLFWWHRFGRVMLGATHGHEAKIGQMPQIMAHRRAEDWGATRFRYVHGFHLHHTARFATEGGGCISEIHQAPVPQDAWHYGSGFLSGRSVQAITYHREFGEVGRVRVAMLDATQ
jgi:hypothetical protein